MPFILRALVLLGPLLKETFIKNKSSDAKLRPMMLFLLMTFSVWVANNDEKTGMTILRIAIAIVSDDVVEMSNITQDISKQVTPTTNTPILVQNQCPLDCKNDPWVLYLEDRVQLIIQDSGRLKDQNDILISEIVSLKNEIEVLRLVNRQLEFQLGNIGIPIPTMPRPPINESGSNDLLLRYRELMDEVP